MKGRKAALVPPRVRCPSAGWGCAAPLTGLVVELDAQAAQPAPLRRPPIRKGSSWEGEAASGGGVNLRAEGNSLSPQTDQQTRCLNAVPPAGHPGGIPAQTTPGRRGPLQEGVRTLLPNRLRAKQAGAAVPRRASKVPKALGESGRNGLPFPGGLQERGKTTPPGLQALLTHLGGGFSMMPFWTTAGRLAPSEMGVALRSLRLAMWCAQRVMADAAHCPPAASCRSELQVWTNLPGPQTGGSAPGRTADGLLARRPRPVAQPGGVHSRFTRVDERPSSNRGAASLETDHATMPHIAEGPELAVS